ncbi:Myc-type basic helix-loop-helix (bHLH) domain [Trinorchestia longiramus]|nr:Myc-type basic helix-loop-helix (bHLH) domain [Trinorchestia longiramus]
MRASNFALRRLADVRPPQLTCATCALRGGGPVATAVHTQEPPRKPKVYRPVSETRKVRKPLMERKRRERINSSLEQLALLLKEAKLVAADKPVAKLEKADILELTVRHLKSVRRINFTSGGVADNRVKKEPEHPSNDGNPAIQENSKLVIEENSENQNEVHAYAKAQADEICRGEELHKASSEKTSDSNYLEGFHKCLTEVRQATESAQEFCALKERLFDHLDSCLHNLTLDTTSREKMGSGKRALSQGNDCETKAKKKRKRCDKEIQHPPNASMTEVPSELTLVPMQLTDGRVAFLVHGDAKILISNNGTDVGKTIPLSGGTVQQPSNDLGGLRKKFPKLLPASEQHKIPNYEKLNSSFDYKPYSATPDLTADGTSQNGVGKIHSMTDETLHAPSTAKVTNLLKLYPNIKTVSLPVGTCATSLQSNNFITISQSSTASSFGNTYLPENKSSQSLGVSANDGNSLTPGTKQQKPFPVSNTFFSEGSNVHTSSPQTSNANHAQCAASQALVRKCVVYPGSHSVSSEASFPSTLSHQAIPTTSAVTSVTVGSQVLHVAGPTSQCSNRAFRANNVMLLSDSGVSLNPSRSSVNNDQIAGPSVVSFPPTPPPSADQYASELPVDGNQPQSYPSSFGSVLTNPALKTIAQSCDLTSHPTIISGIYSYLQYCNSTPQKFVRPTISATCSRDDEEFIDVENISKEDLSQTYGSPANNENLKYNDSEKGDMWRPW